ncbi:MAG: histone deacetylase [Candidatus Cloacimonetes bacterium]|jgi:histone deacetylase 11|nr:histone deacetylase [Candidatus Cloacimonadota bacterium]
MKKKIPIIYSKKYNISVLGLEKLHPFDTKKYRTIYKTLKKQLNLSSKQFYSPYRIIDEDLLCVHSKEYLDSLKRSVTIEGIVEIPIVKFIPNFILQKGILDSMRYATGGTIMGLKLVIEYGWAINLSGGYHHANRDHGEGFCVYADIPIALKSIWQMYPQLKALIIDLDAHQGNGCSNILGKDDRVAILDIYNPFIFPKDRCAENLVSHKLLLYNRTEDKIYLEKLNLWLPKAIIKHKPDVIIYNAGTDIFIDDPMGSLNVTEQGILKRDEIVFRTAKNNKIPILMLLSGGYHKKSGDIVGRSILNLVQKGLVDY